MVALRNLHVAIKRQYFRLSSSTSRPPLAVHIPVLFPPDSTYSSFTQNHVTYSPLCTPYRCRTMKGAHYRNYCYETEGSFEVHGISLYTKTWLPENRQPKAKLCFLHGFSDHINRYGDFFPILAQRGIGVYGLDQRGWGRSVKTAADRGNTGTTAQVLADAAAFIAQHLPSPGPAPLDTAKTGLEHGGGDGETSDDAVPVFVMGHSMGGQETLHLAMAEAHQDVARQVRGWLLETPFIGFPPGGAPNMLKVFAGRWLSKVLPQRQMINPIDVTMLSRDQAFCDAVAVDDLCHNTGTLEGLANMLDRASHLEQGVVTLRKGQMRSLWMGLGTDDRLVSFEKSKAWFEALGDTVEDKELKVYDGWKHCLHAEIGKEEFYKDVGDWILARCEDDVSRSRL